jgi:ABC-type transporter Mla MlaB component
VATDATAQVTELDDDDHACLTFGEPEELFDLTAAFVRDGLAAGLKVIWLTEVGPGPAVTELARRGVAARPAIAAGQMTATACEGQVVSGQSFHAEVAVRWLEHQVDSATRDGFPGLRVAVDMSWALRPVAGIEELPRFEEGIVTALAGRPAAVLCQYDRGRFDPVTLASVAAFHTRAVAAATYHADPLLRICRQYAPPSLRIAGELDYQAQQPLGLALAEAVRLDADITLNLAGLTFIDARCTLMIADAVRTIAVGRKVTVQCLPEVAAGFTRLRVTDLPGVRLVAVSEP